MLGRRAGWLGGLARALGALCSDICRRRGDKSSGDEELGMGPWGVGYSFVSGTCTVRAGAAAAPDVN